MNCNERITIEYIANLRPKKPKKRKKQVLFRTVGGYPPLIVCIHFPLPPEKEINKKNKDHF